MIQKGAFWTGRKISQKDIIHQAILTPEIEKRGIQKLGRIKNKKQVKEIDFNPKIENKN